MKAKSFIAVLLASVIALGLISCGNGKKTGKENASASQNGSVSDSYSDDYAQTEQRFDSFKTTLTKKYGEPKSAEIDGGCHYKECEWADEQIRLEHSYNYIDKEKVTDLQTTLAFGDSGGVCFRIADNQWT
ncbi:MAG: hypothetical protein IJ571_04680 [Ruminococcus sp.]|nr:hypothetical protein [Ruminococcus sp.]